MYFGLTTQEVINSFSQTQESDFAVGNISGGAIILSEIAFQYEKILSILSDSTLQLMDKVAGEVTNVSISGAFTPSLYATNLRGYIVFKGYSPCPGQDLESYDMCWQNLQGGQLSLVNASITSNGNNTYTLNDTFDSKTQNLVLYYDVDQSNLELSSLKTLLRDLVCHSLGSRLFPTGQSDVWSIVSYYGESADKMMTFLQEGNLPSEFKRMKLLNKKSGITSIKLTRG